MPSLAALALCCVLAAGTAPAAEVRNVSPGQDGSRIVFDYNLAGPEAYAEVEVVLTIRGKRYTARHLHLEGDFGRVGTGDGKRIYWNLLDDFPEGLQEPFEWEIAVAGAAEAPAAAEAPKPALPKIEARKVRIDVTDLTGGAVAPAILAEIGEGIVSRSRNSGTGLKAAVVKGGSDRADVILRVRIEEFDTGNATRRIMSLGLGAGRARTRYTIQLIDAGTQAVKRSREYLEQNRNPFRTGSRIESMLADRIGADGAAFLAENVR